MITGTPRYIPEALVGRTLGKYKIMEIIGRGGMGVVYKVWDTLEDKAKAIKMVPPELASSPLAFEDLKREIGLASGVIHLNVVKVLSLEAMDGQYFIVMEYIEGESLEKKIAAAEDRKLKEEDVVRIMKKAAEGIIEAHAQNIIHRDLKPRNIMESNDGQVKILDFGISHRMSRSLTELTGMDNIGTWPYMAPEQLSNKFGRENQQVDVWSFGVTMYQLLAGEVPFKNREQIIDTHEKPFPIEHISRKTHRVIMKCLEKSREKRYQTMKEVQKDLEEIHINNLMKEPGKKEEGARFLDAPRIAAAAVIILALLFLYYAVNRSRSITNEFKGAGAVTNTEKKQTYENYIKQAQEAAAKSDSAAALSYLEKAKTIQHTARVQNLINEIDAQSRSTSIKAELKELLDTLKTQASTETKLEKIRAFFERNTQEALNADSENRAKVSQVREIQEQLQVKNVSITELPTAIINGYNERIRRIEVTGLAPETRVFGKIRVRLQVTRKGKVDAQSIDFSALTISGADQGSAVKAMITKKFNTITLAPPKNKSGAAVNVKEWGVAYKAGVFLGKIILTVSEG